VSGAPGAAAFDVDGVRAQFPILRRRIHDRALVYLDSAASAQKPRAVIDAMCGAMEHSYANVHRGLHTLANETTQAFETARETVRAFVNAPSVEEIIFTKGATEAINLVASSFGAGLVAGDEIILSEMEHHANIVPWHFLRERKGVVLRFLPVDADGGLDLSGFGEMLGKRTKLVALTHMSNVLGTVTPAAEVIATAHAAGVPVLLDGCQAAAHLLVDVQALDVDFYVFSGHKVYGPTGIGALYARRRHLEAMIPYQGGGEMIAEVSLDRITYGELPHKFEAGTPAILEAIGLGAALAWLMGQPRAQAHAHEQALLAHAMAAFDARTWIRVHGVAPGKGAILAFSVEGAHPHDISQLLDRQGVAIRAGHHCAQPLMRHLGVSASARASFALYNTFDEVDALVGALDKARSILV
jgi:cysteine desulfurase/selenocysteine lyase